MGELWFLEGELVFYQETEFKDSKIGKIPKEWEVRKLGDFVIESKEKNKSNKRLKVYTISNKNGFVLSDEFFKKQVYSKNLENYKVVRKHFFAYNPARVNVGSISLFTYESGIVSPMYVVFKVEKATELDNGFLIFLLKSDKYIKEIKRISKSRGSVRQILAFKDLCEVIIPLPPLEEQKAIAEVLRTIQQAIEKTEEVIKATKDFKKSMMKHLFTYGYVGVGEKDRVKLKQTEIGLIPEHWEVVKFENIADFYLGKTPSRKDFDSWENGTFPWVSISDMKEFGYIRQTKEKITEYALNKYFKGKISKAGTLLMSFKLTIGKTSILDIDAVHNEAIISIIPKKNTDKFYLLYCLPTINYADYIDRAIKGNTLNKSKLKQILIPLPPLPEQQAIAEVLQAIDNKIQKEENKKQALENLFKSMLHHLMTGKIRIKQTTEA